MLARRALGVHGCAPPSSFFFLVARGRLDEALDGWRPLAKAWSVTRPASTQASKSTRRYRIRGSSPEPRTSQNRGPICRPCSQDLARYPRKVDGRSPRKAAAAVSVRTDFSVCFCGTDWAASTAPPQTGSVSEADAMSFFLRVGTADSESESAVIDARKPLTRRQSTRAVAPEGKALAGQPPSSIGHVSPSDREVAQKLSQQAAEVKHKAAQSCTRKHQSTTAVRRPCSMA